MMAKIVVVLKTDKTYEFFNAELAIAAPGIYVVQNETGQLAQFPMGGVDAILFPDGTMKVSIPQGRIIQ